MPRSVVDYRLGGHEVYRLVSDTHEVFMRLPDEVLKSVVFLGREEHDPKTWRTKTIFRGTAFFVATPVGCGVNLLSLVTAKHVAERFEKTGPFCIRVNTHDGGSQTIWVDGGIDIRWVYHSNDDSVDAAVLIWTPPSNIAYKAIPSRMFLTPSVIQQKGIGVGDQTYATGLFTYLQGEARNMPIVRTGHVAMMPSELIPVKWRNTAIEGYLIETRSIGGLSYRATSWS